MWEGVHAFPLSNPPTVFHVSTPENGFMMKIEGGGGGGGGGEGCILIIVWHPWALDIHVLVMPLLTQYVDTMLVTVFKAA